MKQFICLILSAVLLISFAVPSIAAPSTEVTSFQQSEIIFDRIDTRNLEIEKSDIVVVLDSKGALNVYNKLFINSDSILVVNSSLNLFEGSSFVNGENGQIVVGPQAWIDVSFENKEDADKFKQSLVGKYVIKQERDDGKSFIVLGWDFAKFYTASSFSTDNSMIICCIGSLAVGFFLALIIFKRKKDIIKE